MAQYVKMTLFTKPEVHNVLHLRGSNRGHKFNIHRKFREIWTYDFRDTRAFKHTDSRAHRNTSHQYRGSEVIITRNAWQCPAWLARSCAVGASYRIWFKDLATWQL